MLNLLVLKLFIEFISKIFQIFKTIPQPNYVLGKVKDSIIYFDERNKSFNMRVLQKLDTSSFVESFWKSSNCMTNALCQTKIQNPYLKMSLLSSLFNFKSKEKEKKEKAWKIGTYQVVSNETMAILPFCYFVSDWVLSKENFLE